MNSEVKTLWLDKLKSGTVKKGTGQLKNGDFYCSLGVLCEISPFPNDWVFDGIFFIKPPGATGIVPDEVLEWSGLTRAQERQIWSTNDHGGRKDNFEKVIKYIEENL